MSNNPGWENYLRQYFRELPEVLITRSSMQHTGCIEFENSADLEVKVADLINKLDPAIIKNIERYDEEDDDFSDADNRSSDSDSGSDIMSDYGDDDDDGETFITAPVKKVFEDDDEIEDIELDFALDYDLKKNFADLTEDEARLLPLSFVLSDTDQYLVILKAFESNFKQTFNLPKINDKTLSIVADACAMSIDSSNKDNENHPVCRSIIEYAKFRNV